MYRYQCAMCGAVRVREKEKPSLRRGRAIATSLLIIFYGDPTQLLAPLSRRTIPVRVIASCEMLQVTICFTTRFHALRGTIGNNPAPFSGMGG